MYYQEKKVIAMIVSGLGVLIAYCLYAYGQVQGGATDLGQDLHFWATTMLFFIVIGIIAAIIIQIVFHFINAVVNHITTGDDEDPAIEDERDRLIALVAIRNFAVIVGIGFVIGLITLVMRKPPALMLNIVFLSFQAGSLFEGFSQLYLYRRGV